MHTSVFFSTLFKFSNNQLFIFFFLFKVTCGLAAGYFLDIQQISTKEPNTFRSQFNAYCFKHSDEARKRAEEDDELSKSSTNKDSDDDDDDDDSSCSSTQSTTIPFTVYRRDQLKNEKWIKEYYKRFSTFVSSTHLNEECSDEYDETVSKEIYEYWIKKRQQNNSMPLIKYIDLVFEQRESADLLIAQINSCLSLRQQMLQVRFYLVVRNYDRKKIYSYYIQIMS